MTFLPGFEQPHLNFVFLQVWRSCNQLIDLPTETANTIVVVNEAPGKCCSPKSEIRALTSPMEGSVDLGVDKINLEVILGSGSSS